MGGAVLPCWKRKSSAVIIDPSSAVPGRGAMKVVSRFEANLLRILHFFLRRLPAEQALPLAAAGLKAPACLGRPAVGLVQDALAKGTVLLLARAGGWRRERH